MALNEAADEKVCDCQYSQCSQNQHGIRDPELDGHFTEIIGSGIMYALIPDSGMRNYLNQNGQSNECNSDIKRRAASWTHGALYTMNGVPSTKGDFSGIDITLS
jgi:hypothetical protein